MNALDRHVDEMDGFFAPPVSPSRTSRALAVSAVRGLIAHLAILVRGGADRRGDGHGGAFASSSDLATIMWALGRMRIPWSTLSGGEDGDADRGEGELKEDEKESSCRGLIRCLAARRLDLTGHELCWSLWGLASTGCAWEMLSSDLQSDVMVTASQAVAACAVDAARETRAMASMDRNIGVLLWALIKMQVPINDLPLALRSRFFDELALL